MKPVASSFYLFLFIIHAERARLEKNFFNLWFILYNQYRTRKKIRKIIKTVLNIEENNYVNKD